MGQRGFPGACRSDSQPSHWGDKLIASGVGLVVGLGIAAGMMVVAKFGASNNDSDAGDVQNGVLLRFNGGTVTQVRQDNKGNYDVTICANPNTAAMECDQMEFSKTAGDLMVEIDDKKMSLADAAIAARAASAER